MEDIKQLDKGLYHHPQPADFVSLKHYMIIEKKRKRCLILRFFNESQLFVNEIEFKLVQLDIKGRVIDTADIKAESMNMAPGETFAIKSGIIISPKCADFTVTILYALADGYKYVIKHGVPSPTYDVSKSSLRKAPIVSRKKPSASKIENSGRLAATLIPFAILTASLLLLIYFSTRSFGNFTSFDFRNLFL